MENPTFSEHILDLLNEGQQTYKTPKLIISKPTMEKLSFNASQAQIEWMEANMLTYDEPEPAPLWEQL